MCSRTCTDVPETRLRSVLEPEQVGRFVCIEPESGDYFLGESLDESVNAALDVHPDRITHTLRIGHDASLHLGVLSE